MRYLEGNLRKFTFRCGISKINYKPLILYNKDGSIYKEYSSKTELMKEFKCCHKTINKAIKENLIYKNIGYLKLKYRTKVTI